MMSSEEKIQQRRIEMRFKDKEQGQTTPRTIWRRRWQERELAEGVGLEGKWKWIMDWSESRFGSRLSSNYFDYIHFSILKQINSRRLRVLSQKRRSSSDEDDDSFQKVRMRLAIRRIDKH
jgi:hypothetical protein